MIISRSSSTNRLWHTPTMKRCPNLHFLEKFLFEVFCRNLAYKSLSSQARIRDRFDILASYRQPTPSTQRQHVGSVTACLNPFVPPCTQTNLMPTIEMCHCLGFRFSHEFRQCRMSWRLKNNNIYSRDIASIPGFSVRSIHTVSSQSVRLPPVIFNAQMLAIFFLSRWKYVSVCGSSMLYLWPTVQMRAARHYRNKKRNVLLTKPTNVIILRKASFD